MADKITVSKAKFGARIGKLEGGKEGKMQRTALRAAPDA